MVIEWLIKSIETLSMGNLYIAAFLAGSICLLLTFLGTLPSIFGRRVTQGLIDVGLGFSAGIMIVTSFTSLLIPGIEMEGVISVLTGFILGAFTVLIIEKTMPHHHVLKGEKGSNPLIEREKAVWMIIIAMMIHNFPEGLAVGASISYSIRDGVLTAIAIGIQDIPEGLVVALPLVGLGKDIKKAMGIGFLSGVSEPLMAVIPVFITSTSLALLPLILGFAAGSMIFVVSHEVIPETFRHGNEDIATIGLIIGFAAMLLLETLI